MFVFVAAAVTFAGLDPDSKAEVGALAEDTEGNETSLSAAQENKEVYAAELGPTG